MGLCRTFEGRPTRPIMLHRCPAGHGKETARPTSQRPSTSEPLSNSPLHHLPSLACIHLAACSLERRCSSILSEPDSGSQKYSDQHLIQKHFRGELSPTPEDPVLFCACSEYDTRTGGDKLGQIAVAWCLPKDEANLTDPASRNTRLGVPVRDMHSLENRERHRSHQQHHMFELRLTSTLWSSRRARCCPRSKRSFMYTIVLSHLQQISLLLSCGHRNRFNLIIRCDLGVRLQMWVHSRS